MNDSTSLTYPGTLRFPTPSASMETQPPVGKAQGCPSFLPPAYLLPSRQPWEGRIDAAAAGRVLLAIDCSDFSEGLGANKPATSPTTIQVSGSLAAESAALLAGNPAGREGVKWEVLAGPSRNKGLCQEMSRD